VNVEEDSLPPWGGIGDLDAPGDIHESVQKLEKAGENGGAEMLRCPVTSVVSRVDSCLIDEGSNMREIAAYVWIVAVRGSYCSDHLSSAAMIT
jgi:hypothetical protein